jgi:hypothetical protein
MEGRHPSEGRPVGRQDCRTRRRKGDGIKSIRQGHGRSRPERPWSREEIAVKKSLKNIRCAVEYDPEKKEIAGRDFTDKWNEPAFYSKSKRGMEVAWAEVEFKFTPETTMHDLLTILENNHIRVHYWCMVD